MAAKIKQSETKTVMRSQINFNPLNPKRHVDEAIALQMRNFKKVGILGGIVLNETTSNLLDGHRRVMALDRINKYDGTPETDYPIKVEVTVLSEKEEKEQMTYMAMGNTQADLDLIAKYIGDIDTKDIGLTPAEIQALEQFNITEEDIYNSEGKDEAVEEFFNFLPTATVKAKDADTLTPEQKKAKVLEGKALNNSNSDSYDDNLSLQILVTFSSVEEKYAFSEMTGIEPDAEVVKGETILALL